MKGLSKGRYDETFAGEDGYIIYTAKAFARTMIKSTSKPMTACVSDKEVTLNRTSTKARITI